MKISAILFCLGTCFLGFNSAQAMIKEEKSIQSKIASLNVASSDTQNTKSTDLADKLGVGLIIPRNSESAFYHNICKSLEFQHICFDIIKATFSALKNLSIAIENYKQIIEKTDLFEMNSSSVNDMAMGDTIQWKMKPFNTIEVYYCCYALNNLTEDYKKVNELKNLAQTYMNIPNEEIQKLAQLILAKSKFDECRHEYLQLISVYKKVYQQEPVVNDLLQAYYQEMQESIKNKTAPNAKIKFFPSSLFDYLINTQKCSSVVNNSNTFQSKIKNIEQLTETAHTFINNYIKNKELFFNNYKITKNILKKSSRNFIKTKYKNYLDNTLDFYSLDHMKYSLAPEDLAFIKSFIKNDIETQQSSESILSLM